MDFLLDTYLGLNFVGNRKKEERPTKSSGISQQRCLEYSFVDYFSTHTFFSSKFYHGYFDVSFTFLTSAYPPENIYIHGCVV